MIQFDFNSDAIQPESAKQLEELAQALKNENLVGTRILIEGHADSRGSVNYNLALSERRALCVKHFLVKKFAFPEDRFQTSGYGETRPLVPNDTETHCAINRRVEFVNETELSNFLKQMSNRKRSGEVDQYDMLY